MDTPSQPSLSEKTDSSFDKSIPKIFTDSTCLEQNISEPKHSPSFIQKIMSNAKSMLSTRYISLQSSTCSDDVEEPTRETDMYRKNNVECQSNVFVDQGPLYPSSKVRSSYTSSDFCFMDEESSRLENSSTTETFPREQISRSIGDSATRESTKTNFDCSGNETLASNISPDESKESRFSRSLPITRFPTGCLSDKNGPFEPSDFFVPLEKHCNNVLSGVCPHVCTVSSDSHERFRNKSITLIHNWVNPVSNKIDGSTQKNDIHVPCRDSVRSFGADFPSTIKHMSKSAGPSIEQVYVINNIETNKNQPSTSNNNVDIEELQDIPEEFSATPSITRMIHCTACRPSCSRCLKRNPLLNQQIVSIPSPSPSYGDEIWRSHSERVKTLYCENESFASKMLVCGDESNISNTCVDENSKKSDLEDTCNYKNTCSLKKIGSDSSERAEYSTHSAPRTSHQDDSYFLLAKSVNDPHISSDNNYCSEGINKENGSNSKCRSNSLPNTIHKRDRSISNTRDQDNQCAFVGSPILLAANFKVRPKPIIDTTKEENDSEQFGEMISDVNTKEKVLHSQIQGIKNREKAYNSMYSNLQGEIARGRYSMNGESYESELEKVTRELKNENNLLKSEVMEMKLELKHTLEKVQGPMRVKLEAEKGRCEQLQSELQKASQNMMMSQENYVREMNNLKMQLCMACSNMTELESINKRLKDEMTTLDGLCSKLEDDLMQQKISEADTIRRLTNRKGNLEDSQSIMVYNCESNLHDIARKLSKTIKDCIPCAACATGLPAELKGAAKLIKDLTDMVESRKNEKIYDSLPPSRTDTSCQSPPTTGDTCTQCMDIRNIGTIVSTSFVNTSDTPKTGSGSDKRKLTRTLYCTSPIKLQEQDSSQFSMKFVHCKTGPDERDSKYSTPQTSVYTCDVKSKKPIKNFRNTSPSVKDNSTDPKMIDKQISSGHFVRFNSSSSSINLAKKSKIPATCDALTDPMMQDKNFNSSSMCDLDQCSKPPCEEPLKTSNSKEALIVKETHEESVPNKPINIQQYCNDPQVDTLVVYEVNTALINTPPNMCEQPECPARQSGSSTNPLDSACSGCTVKHCGRPDCPKRGMAEYGPPTVTAPFVPMKFSPSSKVCDRSDCPLRQLSQYKNLDAPCSNCCGGILPDNCAEYISKPKVITSPPCAVGGADPPCASFQSCTTPCEQPKKGCPKTCEGIKSAIKPQPFQKPGTPVPKSSYSGQRSGGSSGAQPGSVCDCAGRSEKEPGPIELKVKMGVVTEGKSKLKLSPDADGAITECAHSFPFEVDTRMDVLNEPPPGLNITTAVTSSGQLEVITEGPAGTIETMLNYKEDGVIEVITQIMEQPPDSDSCGYTTTSIPPICGQPPCPPPRQPPCPPPQPPHSRPPSGPNFPTPPRPPTPTISAPARPVTPGALPPRAASAPTSSSCPPTGSKKPCKGDKYNVGPNECPSKRFLQKPCCPPPGPVLSKSPQPQEPPCSLETRRSASATEICPCPSNKGVDIKPSRSCGTVCLKGKVDPETAGQIWSSNTDASTSQTKGFCAPTCSKDNPCNTGTGMVVDCSQCCLSQKTGAGTNTPQIYQVSKTTSEFNKKNNISFETSKINTKEAGGCCDQRIPINLQTLAINFSSKSTGDEDTRATCGSSTNPVSVSEKSEDTCLCSDLKSDQEISVKSQASNKSVCTDCPGFQSAATDPVATAKDVAVLCDCMTDSSVNEAASKEASVSQTRDSSCQSTPPPTEQSCQCCECTDIGVSTSKLIENKVGTETMTRGKFPVKDITHSANTSPYSNTTHPSKTNTDHRNEPQSVCETDCVGDTAHSEYQSALDLCDCEKKKKQKEVPDFVSKVGSRDATPPPPSDRDTRPKKKRTGQLENLFCLCPGPCQCVVCAPNVMDQREKETGSRDPSDPHSQLTCLGDHPRGCKCRCCRCYPCTPCPPEFAEDDFECNDDYECSPRNKINQQNDDGAAEAAKLNICEKLERRHGVQCECIDCLCMPTVRELAMTKEYPIPKNLERQVYQVTQICHCANTRKGSKIPTSTNPNVSKPKGSGLDCNCVGRCVCSPCTDPVKRAGPKSGPSKQVKKMTAEELEELCDCGRCDCPVCTRKRASKMCCCTPDCICDTCKIDLMKKQIKTLKKEINELKGVIDMDIAHPEGCTCGICNCPDPPGEFKKPEKPEGCDCKICECPLAPGKGGDMSGCSCEDCECPKGPKFQKPKIKKPIDLTGCTCNPCKCPGGPLSAFPVCDCKKCECDPCSDPRKPKKVSCDCDPCECSPCADVKKQSHKYHPKDCTCKDCLCSGLKEDECVCLDPCVCGEQKHPPDCTCEICICEPPHPPGCECPVCKCGDKAVDHPPGCQCDKCKCPGPIKPQGPCATQKALDAGLKAYLKSASTHAMDCACAGCICLAKACGGALMCMCSPCKCKECLFDKLKVFSTAPDCKCPVCKCRDCDQGGRAPGCKCDTCMCKTCTHRGGGAAPKAKDCKCGVCACKECGAAGKAVKETKSAPAVGGPLPSSRSCHCIQCYCDVCNNPAKKGSGARPAITIVGKKTVKAGPSASSIRAKSAPSGDQSGKCTCGNCLCKECEFGGGKKNPNCTCNPCNCKECSDSGTDKSSKSCTCNPCNCTECSKMEQGAGCKCKSCKCKECSPNPPPPKKDAECHCATCTCKECSSGGGGGGFEAPKKMDCDCNTCQCVICAKKKDGGGGGGGFEPPVRMPCQCNPCKCENCNKGGGQPQQPSGPGVGCPPSCVGRGGSTFEVPERLPCQCKQCNCAICEKQGGDSKPSGGGKLSVCTKEAPPFEIPSRLPCQCNPCKCALCNKQGGKKEGSVMASPTTASTSVQCVCSSSKPKPKPPPPPPSKKDCDCPVCSCPSSSSMKDSTPDCDCPTCRCNPCADMKVRSQVSVKVGMSLDRQSKSTSCLCNVKNAKVGESESRFGGCESISINFSSLDNATLMKKIEDNTKENSTCKNQIDEITSALSSIKSACTEAEEKVMKAPLVKQASAFGQTMSGLKLALNNLQEKCKAKDQLIEAMTGELKNRTNTDSFYQVLDTCVSGDCPDYDKASDLAQTNFEQKKSRAMAGDRVVRKKRSSKTCKCGKLHKDKDYKHVNLTGFEVIDIRRITDDSIIIKWKPPKNGPVTGYDIFINGVNKSKVMSGGRTSAMVHSIDLSSTIQITIYAVTKCGRCEPPAIAIYEIRS